MRVLRGLKVPGMIVLSVGAVWLSAWNQGGREPGTPVVMLPPTTAMKQITAEVKQRALEAGEPVADLSDLSQ